MLSLNKSIQTYINNPSNIIRFPVDKAFLTIEHVYHYKLENVIFNYSIHVDIST